MSRIFYSVLTLGIWLLGTVLLVAQDRVEVTPTFRFKDGIYLNLEDFQSNTPGLAWDQFEKALVINPETLLSQVDYIRYKNSKERLDLSKIWGFSVDGLPFVRIPKDSIYKTLESFAGLRLAGKICYYSFESREERSYEIAAYNPLNGQPFRQATVSRSVNVFKEKIFLFEDGNALNFNRKHLEPFIKDDPELLGVLADLDVSDPEYQEKLFRLLMAYNRRHSIYFRQ